MKSNIIKYQSPYKYNVYIVRWDSFKQEVQLLCLI